MADSFVLIDGNETRTVPATLAGGQVRLSPESLELGLGWTLEAEGLCRGPACIPLLDRDAWIDASGVELQALARALDRPLALDLEERAAALGTSAAERAGQLASLEAPDFELPNLEGRLHRLSEHRGKKVLLIAYASW